MSRQEQNDRHIIWSDIMRLNPNRGEYNLYCYCYQKEWLNNHLKNAERGIRFIDPHYQEQFRIADGEKISIKLGDGKTMERTCRYIDDYHLEVGTNLYHICEFAELCERNGHTVEPVLLSSKIGPVLANNFPPQLLKNLFSVSEAPALIIKVQYLALMRQPVQQSCCEDSVAKKLRPAIKAFI